MRLYIFAVRDRMADVFGSPFMQASKNMAIRTFSDSVNAVGDTGGLISKHPDDFDLYQLGTWDDNTGLYSTGQPEQIAIGKEVFIGK